MPIDLSVKKGTPIKGLPAQNFITNLRQKEIKFDARAIDKGKDWVMVRFTGKNCPAITVQFFFDADGESVSVKSFCICKAPPETRALMLEAVNVLNVKYRWLSFYIDGDEDVCCNADSLLNAETSATVCFNLLVRFITIVDEAYPVLMQAFSAGTIVH